MKKKLLLSIATLTVMGTFAQNVYIPDAALKNHLVNWTNADVDGDSEISQSEAFGYTGIMNLSGLGIADFTGLEAFGSIQYIDCSYNGDATNLDLSGNWDLVELNCEYCGGLTNLDLSNNVFLGILNASNCGLSTLTLPSTNSVTYLDVSANNLTALNAGTYSSLSFLDVSFNPMAGGLSIFPSAPLDLNLSNTLFAGLSFVSYPNVVDLTISNCTSLTELYLSNGNNTNLTYQGINNPNLTCIQVDDANYSSTNWTNVDATVTFSENCASVGVNEVFKLDVSVYPTPTEGRVNFTTSEIISTITIFNLTGQQVSVFNNENVIDISHLPSGIYTATIQTKSGKTALKKLVKE